LARPHTARAARVDAGAIGRAATRLGAGRQRQEDEVDPAVGITLLRKRGDRVSRHEPVATLQYNDRRRPSNGRADRPGSAEPATRRELRYGTVDMQRRWGDGREVAYDDSGGDGAPVVLLHPFPFDRRIWADTVAALAPAHRVIAVDARGFGECGPPTAGYSIADLADDLAGLLDALAITAAAVVGLSMGGYVALALAQRHPRRLAALALADTRAAADTPPARSARAEAMALVRDAGPGVYLDRSLPRLLAADAPPALLARARALAETRPASLIAGIEALRDRPDRTAELGAIGCPTLVVAGGRDQVVPPAEMRAMSQAIPRARFVTLEGAGHLTNLEAPQAFNRTLSEFLAPS
jgi:pimeloyl-ACP methyl ester carboxylesterase